jgi:excisionase family DNA binding protein
VADPLDGLRTLLQKWVADAVTDALLRVPAANGGDAPALLDRQGLARQLGCSPATVDRLCRAGLPFIRVGEARRFSLERVLSWLEQRPQTRGSRLRLVGSSRG